jgi:AcrR family transcriptional regulator
VVPTRPRERILDTAEKLFYQHGIRAVGVNRIIADAGAAPMTLYRQFGGKDELVAAALEQWSVSWLHRLTHQLDCGGDDPAMRLAALWDALEAWFAGEDFNGSFVTNVATELRSEPAHPAHRVVATHRLALRQLLEDLAKLAGSDDPAGLATELQVLVDGVVTVTMVDRRRGPGVVAGARVLAEALLAVNRSGRTPPGRPWRGRPCGPWPAPRAPGG